MIESAAHAPNAIAARDLLGPSRSLRGVEIFAVGVHRGEDWGADRLRQAVANFRRFRDSDTLRIEPVAVLGHSEEQALTEDAGLPNVGLVSDLRLSGNKLIADFKNVPELVARLIEAGRYNTVSAEFWPHLEDNGTDYGTTLRRVAFLGSEMPQVKSLNPQGLAATVSKHTDFSPRTVRLRGVSRPHLTNSGTFLCFSEVTTVMDRDTMLKMLPPGLDPAGAFVSGLSDEQLGQLVAEYHVSEQSAEGPHTAESGGIPVPPVLNADPVPDNSVPEPPKEPVDPMKYADALKALEGKLAVVQKFADERLKAEKSARVQRVIDDLVAGGKLLPAAIEVTRFALEKADASAVSKFSDGTSGTEFDAIVRKLEAQPKVVEFGDRLKQRGQSQPDLDAGLRRGMLEATPLGRSILRDESKANRN